jgi:hypothetical protein
MLIALSLALAQVQAATPAPAPGDFSRDEETATLTFHYGWPAAAGAIPALRARLQADMERDHRLALSYVAESRRDARRNRIEFNPHSYSKNWEMTGDNDRLISLTAETGAFTGGAHDNSSFSAILWDKQAGAPVTAAALFGAAALQGMSARFCAALNRQRAENREGEEPAEPGDMFSECPPLAEQVVAPADMDHDGRFDTLRVLMAPYEAGPYVEGDYIVEVPFGAPDLAALPAAWRPAFQSPGAR